MNGVVVGICEVCGAQRFPRQSWCPACGSDRIRDAMETRGTVEETTIVRHTPARHGPPVRVGTVRLNGGALVVARLEPGVGERAEVELLTVDGAPVARQPATR